MKKIILISKITIYKSLFVLCCMILTLQAVGLLFVLFLFHNSFVPEVKEYEKGYDADDI